MTLTVTSVIIFLENVREISTLRRLKVQVSEVIV